MGTMKKGILVLDPRTKILLLLGINIYVFTNSYVWAEIIVMAALIILLLLCGVYKAALKSAVTYIALLAIKYFLLPFCPEIILTSLNIVVITFRKLLPCVTLATLLVQTTPIRLLMHALQRWHLPQTVIIPLAITVRYFPTLREEQQAISDAMKLRNVHGVFQKLEYIYVPLMLSASTTADELSQAITARGIDNPRPKTCAVSMRFHIQDYVLEIDNLSVSYKNRTIFSNASFAAARGDIIAVTGRNGSGKSAFLRVLCGLMKEKAGRIVFDGKPYPYKKRRELCYMTMQDVVHQLFSDSVWEEFSLLNKTVDEQEITKILRRLDLLDYKDKHPMTLSGGQKQRLALAVATLANKDIMIFDEPTSGLDYGNMIKVCELIKELSSNRIVFVATHDRELMGLLCTRRMEISNESISVYDLTTK